VISNRKIFAVTSIPDRIQELEQTINSIYDQADVIYVFLSGHKEPPSYLEREKITFIVGDNSLGDVAKFYWFEQESGYYFSLDDDLIYPQNYSERMIEFLKSVGGNAAVSLHGRKFNKLPLKSYYHDTANYQNFRCLDQVQGDHRIHVGGTGVMLCHTDTLSLSISHFERPNMADIWMSIQAAIQDVPMYCLGHEKGWIKYIESMLDKYTIYSADHNRDQFQTKVVNDFDWPDF
jgi:hypothetical protein